MAKLTVTRKNEFYGKIRKIKLYVDGVNVARIASGESIDLEVVPGTHTMKAKMDWYGSNTYTFTVEEGYNTALTLSFNSTTKIIQLVGVVVVMVAILPIENVRYISFIGKGAILLGYVLFSILFGRNNYMVIKDFID